MAISCHRNQLLPINSYQRMSSINNVSSPPRSHSAPSVLISMVICSAVLFLATFITPTRAYAQGTSQQPKLRVTVTNIKNNGKTLYIGVYRATDEFPEFTKFWKNAKVTTDGATEKIEFDVPYGEYAIAVVHDINGNGKLDTNFFGYPSEPFAFSRGFKPVLSGPDFSDCKFSFSSTSTSITITLID